MDNKYQFKNIQTMTDSELELIYSDVSRFVSMFFVLLSSIESEMNNRKIKKKCQYDLEEQEKRRKEENKKGNEIKFK